MTTLWKPEILDPANVSDTARIKELMSDSVQLVDHGPALQDEIGKCLPGVKEVSYRIVYYPWRNLALRLPEAGAFHGIRENRNRLKIDDQAAERIHAAHVGIVGLSTGYAIAMAMVSLGFQRFRLADFDALELTNLNRIPASLMDIGLNKCVSAARRMAEINPYCDIEIHQDGVNPDNCTDFVAGLDQLIEVCDSFSIKVALRETCRAARVPVIMNTSDRCMLDVERYDQEPERALFHGLAGDLNVATLSNMGADERVGLALRIIVADNVSTGLGASLFEIDRTLQTWPQLSSDVTSGAGAVADIARRIAVGLHVASGRSFGQSYLDLVQPEPDYASFPSAPPRDTDCATGDLKRDMIAAAKLAPSGGNAQRWHFEWKDNQLELAVSEGVQVAMDIDQRGSLVAVGAAWMNARALAAARRSLGDARLSSDDRALVELGDGDGGLPSYLAEFIPRRMTNRRPLEARGLSVEDIAALKNAAWAEGGELVLFEGEARNSYANFLARVERLRFLSPQLHDDLARELVWPGEEPVRRGLDVRTLELSPPDLEKVKLAMRPDIMAALRERNLGAALGDPVKDAFAAAGLGFVITIEGEGQEAYMRGGAALQRVWLEATCRRLWAQPWSPCFLYAQTGDEAASLMPEELKVEARALHEEWVETVGLGARKAVLSLRMGYGVPPTAVSLRE
ncbi:Rv1355c family protein [Pseudovibrio sp. POLY-S9]|uniref:Rv1355c family protein n=1 Tax=Pseudovibrio sp. POLY-S9 TaxID=1576596 RepID=UPI000709E265|nr:Rv1355c family protein [Pseudovibrio sp. POLY-S9]